jgi:DNA-binding Lrp family transcriptional regulator
MIEKRTFDEKDKAILTMFSRNPGVSQDAIAKEIGLRQPSVAVRLRKLKDRGALEIQAGIDPFRIGLQMAKVDITSSNPAKVLDMFRNCPYFLNGFIVSGRDNLTLLFVAEQISTLEAIVDGHLRRLPEVTNVDFNIVIMAAKNMVMPVQLVWKKGEKQACGITEYCKDCDSFSSGRCAGCPIVEDMEGWFF